MGANLLHINFAFPVVRGKYTMGMGLRPYSLVNYKFSREELIRDPATGRSTGQFSSVTERGSGGVSQAYWAHGVKLAKGVSVGIELIYNFGAIKDERFTTPIGPDAVPLRTLDFIEQNQLCRLLFYTRNCFVADK